MKALAIRSGTAEAVLVERPEPQITTADQVKLKVLRIGICGTDRDQYATGRVHTPAGAGELVIGHEMLGQVVETGDAVSDLRPGDLAAMVVRRGCGQCLPCLSGRSDMCETGAYTERGIFGADGFAAEYVVDNADYAVKVPQALEAIGILCEPLSVCEKAIDVAVRTQAARLPTIGPGWPAGRHCLVTGLGPIGLLASLVLRLRGATVFGTDIVDAASPRPRWLQAIGGQYIDARETPADKIADSFGLMDLAIEASGAAAVAFSVPLALGFNGIMVQVGAHGGQQLLPVPGSTLIVRTILRNLAVVGTVNSAPGHFEMAVDDLLRARLLWGDHVAGLITNRFPYTAFADALRQHAADEIKAVIEWAQ